MRNILCLILLIYPFVSYSESSGARSITAIGCHKSDNTCFLSISGAPVGPANCSSTSLRWNETNDANGKAALALLTTAFMAGKLVIFYVTDNACYTYQPNYPTFSYFNIAR